MKTSIIIDGDMNACRRLSGLLDKITGVINLAVVNDSEQAISTILKLKPDFVFMEIEMPGKSGFDVVSEVRMHQMDIRFVVVTGHKQYAIKALRHDAFDYLLKPVDIEDLKMALNRL